MNKLLAIRICIVVLVIIGVLWMLIDNKNTNTPNPDQPHSCIVIAGNGNFMFGCH